MTATRSRQSTNRIRTYGADHHDAGASNPGIFKAYDIRGSTRRAQRGRGPADRPRASSPTSAQGGSRVSRDMRVSSPTMAAAFIDGARAQGADVVDYGMLATDMMYFAVAPRRPRRRRADHRLAQPEASTTASSWCARRRSRSAATPASATSAT